MSLISRSSATRSWFVSALAAADSSSLRMSWAAPRVEKRSSGSASSRGRPRTWSATRRALRGATRTKRALALTTGRSADSFGLGLALDPAAVFVAAVDAPAFGFLAAVFFAAGFFAGALEVDVAAALLSAVFEVASAAPLPFVAVSALGFGFAAGFFAAGFLAGVFFAGDFLAGGFFAWSFSVFFSSAIC